MKWTMRWGSHIPILVKLLSVTTGDVLELGMGIYSTPLLFWMCVSRERKLVSYESSDKYFNMLGKNNNSNHESHLINDWNTIDMDRNWDIVLIDCEPMDIRSKLAARVTHKTKFIVLHDSQPRDDQYYHYEKIYPLFRYRFDYTKFMPHTTVLSNYAELEFLR